MERPGAASRRSGDRDRYAVGLELNIPIFSTLSANVAGRYDKYDEFWTYEHPIVAAASKEADK